MSKTHAEQDWRARVTLLSCAWSIRRCLAEGCNLAMRGHISCQQRHSEPIALRRLWKAIDVIRGQRQIANIARLTKVIQRDHPYRAKDIMQHILQAIQDNVVIETLTVGCKGSKAGLEQEGYWIPEDPDILKLRGSSDSYCFICHKPGRLVICNACDKVYHKDCNNTFLPPQDSGDMTFLCQFCCRRKMISPLDVEKKRELNRCLRFIARRAMDAVTALVSQPCPEDYTHYRYFIWEHQTLKMLADDCVRQKFESICGFERQINLIFHNCVILEGEDSVLTKEAKKMMDICTRELKELELCINCYLLSTTKPSRSWFCMPCNPPHKVVWAKQKGFEYWPAKVIQFADGKIDVRFFGGHHERAWVTLQCIKCITISPAELHIKKTKGWMRASEEMKQYLAQTEAMLGRVSAKRIVEFELPSDTNFERRTEVLDKEDDDESLPVIVSIRENCVKQRPSVDGMELDSDMPCSSSSIACSNNLVTDYDKSTSNSHHPIADKIGEIGAPFVLSKASNCGGHAQKYCRRSLPKQRREKCNCRRIYARKLFFYQASVRRMRLKERRNNLMISARFVHQYLKKHSDKFVSIQDENVRLRAENAELKAKLAESQSEQGC